MDRASDFGSEGWGFESLRARQSEYRIEGEVELRARVLFAAALVALAACDRSEKPKAPSASSGAPAPAAAATPGAGDVVIEMRDGRVTIVCQDAPRGLVLERLAREAGFELAGDLDSQPMTLRVDAQPLELALPALLAGSSYRAQWRWEAEPQRTTLAKLEVGEASAATQTAAQPKNKLGEALRERLRAMREKKPNEKAKADAAQRREERARTQADALEELRSSNPEMRMEAVADIEPEGPALSPLLDALANDPDPRVRAKIAEQLADAEGCTTALALANATGDPDPAVRRNTWTGLEMLCDESMLIQLQAKCSREMDPSVQEVCRSTLEICE